MTSEATISINGGPEVPMSTVKAALGIIKAHGQSDLEDFTGRSPDNDHKSEVVAADRLRSIIDRIERLEEERKALASDIKDIYLEAKSAGFDPGVLKTLIRMRKKEPAEIEEQETLLDLYKRALGM